MPSASAAPPRSLQRLYAELAPDVTDHQLVEDGGLALPFRNLQLFFYWSCMGEDGESRSGCSADPTGDGPDGSMTMRWGYNFGCGFQGTDQDDKAYFVMVYYPYQ
jgi:hypothetical protein